MKKIFYFLVFTTISTNIASMSDKAHNDLGGYIRNSDGGARLVEIISTPRTSFEIKNPASIENYSEQDSTLTFLVDYYLALNPIENIDIKKIDDSNFPSLLGHALIYKNLILLKKLHQYARLVKGKDINAPVCCNFKDIVEIKDLNFLNLAIIASHTEAIKFLLSVGADLRKLQITPATLSIYRLIEEKKMALIRISSIDKIFHTLLYLCKKIYDEKYLKQINREEYGLPLIKWLFDTYKLDTIYTRDILKNCHNSMVEDFNNFEQSINIPNETQNCDINNNYNLYNKSLASEILDYIKTKIK